MITNKTKTDKLLDEIESDFLLKSEDVSFPIHFEFYTNWSSLLFKPMNWREFTFIDLSIERTYYTNSFEIHLAIIGLHLNINIYFKKKE